jgi:type VI secretion system protein VasG
MIKSITRLQLDRIKHRVETGQGIDFVYDDAVVDLVVSRCTELESGGRMIDSILTNTLLPEISNQFLTHMLEGSPISKVEVTAKDGEFVYGLSH